MCRKFTGAQHPFPNIPVDDAGAVPAGPTVLNVLSGSVGMSSVEKHMDDISGAQESDDLCVCVSV